MKTIKELEKEIQKIDEQKLEILNEIEKIEKEEIYLILGKIKWFSDKKWNLDIDDRINLSTKITYREKEELENLVGKNIDIDRDNIDLETPSFSLDYYSDDKELNISFNRDLLYIGDFLDFIDKYKIQYINKVEYETRDSLNIKIKFYTKLIELLKK